VTAGSALFRLAREGRYEDLMPLHRWFMPFLHPDARPDLVQCVKCCGHLVGRGSALIRPPRLPLEGTERQEVEATFRSALANRPTLPVRYKAA
jgi:1-pyrroline-4-hydroxy-2-carboxylate deaminase